MEYLLPGAADRIFVMAEFASQAPTRGLFFTGRPFPGGLFYCPKASVSHPGPNAVQARLPRRHATAAGHAGRAGRNGLGGSWALIVKEQGQRPPVGGGFADTLAVVAVALDLYVNSFYSFVKE